MTKTLLKNDNVFIYEDYKGGRSALRLREFSTANPAQQIRRNSNGPIKAVLVSKAWWDAQAAIFAADIAAVPAAAIQMVDDDFMGVNLSTMIDLVVGHAETVVQAKRVAADGFGLKYFKAYSILDKKKFYQDDSNVIVDGARGGNALGYLIHPSHYAALLAATVAGAFVGAGNGTALVELYNGFAVLETFTITLTSATAYTVVGSVSGALGAGVVGKPFETAVARFTLTAGTIAFVAADVFTVESYDVVVA